MLKLMPPLLRKQCNKFLLKTVCFPSTCTSKENGMKKKTVKPEKMPTKQIK